MKQTIENEKKDCINVRLTRSVSRAQRVIS